tara:strand:+ start:1510 stop:2148 length:639 start_codon:yes stop_codon:yes gene_type:complete
MARGGVKFKRMKIDTKSFIKDVKKSSRAFHKSVFPIINSNFENKKEAFLEAFENHPITQQMYAGADSPGMNFPGGPLGGVSNLFAFLGFRDGDDPAESLRIMLTKYIVLLKNYRVKTSPKGIIYTHRVKMPQMEEIYDRTPMRWTSRSWIKAVEFGVSGFQFLLRGYRKGSRSGGAFLSKKQKVRSGRFQNQSYLSSLYREFQKDLTGARKV